jgi:hypothetical protein
MKDEKFDVVVIGGKQVLHVLAGWFFLPMPNLA